MKFFSLSVAILFSFLVLILAFENLGAKTMYFLLLFIPADSIPAFFITLILALLGFVTGVFYTLFFMEAVREKSDNGSNESEPE
jgi:multisubunit Na+/H+ antiporter MnhF subunit